MPFFHFADKNKIDSRIGYRKEIRCEKCEYIAINLKDLKLHIREVHAY